MDWLVTLKRVFRGHQSAIPFLKLSSDQIHLITFYTLLNSVPTGELLAVGSSIAGALPAGSLVGLEQRGQTFWSWSRSLCLGLAPKHAWEVHIGGSPNLGVQFWGPNNEIFLGSILGFPYLGKVT